MQIKKAIIPAAGLGTRFLPATKAQPKEMLPIVYKPAIQYIVEEAVASGIEDILIITGRGKRAIEDHFDKSFELEETLAKKEKWDLLDVVRQISNLANIHYIRQKEPKGLGDAVLCAKTFIGNEPFAVLLGDDIVQAETPVLRQLISVYERYHCPMVGVKEVRKENVSKYGIIDIASPPLEHGVFKVLDFIEKPQPENAPSNIAIMGRYILPPAIFNILENQTPGAGGEIQLTDALKTLVQHQPIIAYLFSGKRYDIGDKLGFLEATVDFALSRNELKDAFLKYLEGKVRQI